MEGRADIGFSHPDSRKPNCGGPHGAWADACAAKREAGQSARGWRSPFPPRRERRTKGAVESLEDESPVVETPVAREVTGEMEVEVESALALEMEE